MTTRLFPHGISAMAHGNATLGSDTFTCYLIATGGANGYTFNTAHSGLNFVSAVYRASHGTANVANLKISASGSAYILIGDTVAIGTASANATNSVFHAAFYCKSGTTEANSFAIAYQDLNTPVTANGGGVNIANTGIIFGWV